MLGGNAAGNRNDCDVTVAENESEIYDRQIRLWGADAQSKMASAKVLYVNMSGVSSEILKNLILAGVRCAICDGRPYPEAVIDMPSSFFPPSERKPSNGCETDANDDAADNDERPSKKPRLATTVAKAIQPHVQELNPLLPPPTLAESSPSTLPPSYFHQYDVVIASHLSLTDATRIAKATTEGGGKFYLVHAFGWEACALVDLGEGHEWRREVGKDKLEDKVRRMGDEGNYLGLGEMIGVELGDLQDRWHKRGKPPKVWARYKAILNYYEKVGEWPSGTNLNNFREITKKFLVEEGLGEDYLGDTMELGRLGTVAMAEVSPVCAVIAGVIGNEVIKVISGKGEPANNTLMFDGKDGGCRNFTIKKK